MVAGLEEVTSGEIRIGDSVVNDLPPVERDIAMVFQNYALYPHMTVAREHRLPAAAAGRQEGRSEAARARCRAPAVDRGAARTASRARSPAASASASRSAARSCAGRMAFLMDEPLSNLDAKLRVQMRAELISLHKRLGITTIYVTHDQTEAMTLGDRVVVMNKGVVQQVDTPAQLYNHPANTFVAGFIGSPAMNFLSGRLDGGAVLVGSHRVELPETTRSLVSGRTGDVVVGVRPEDFVTANGDGIAAEVAFTESLGPETLVHFRSDALEVVERLEQVEAGEEEQTSGSPELLVARFGPTTTVAADEQVSLKITAERMLLFDPASGSALN